MKTVGKIVSELKLSSSDVLDYLNRMFYTKFTLNSKIDLKTEENILKHFSKGNFSKTKPDESQPNFRTFKVFTENIFQTVVQVITHPNYPSIQSFFSDTDAQVICSRMANRRIRYFSNLFLSNDTKIDHVSIRYQIHYLANKAIEFYGGEILTFVYGLKSWSKVGTKVEVFKFDKGAVYDFETNFSKIRLQSFNGKGDYTIHFKRAYERPLGSLDALKIRRPWTNEFFTISIKGELIANFEDCIPEIALFQETINGQYMLYAGYDDGFCDICGRKLTDAISIKYGRGPECRRNNGNPW